MAEKKRKVVSMLTSDGVTKELWGGIEIGIRNTLIEALKNGFTDVRIGYDNEIGSYILKLITELKASYPTVIFVEAVIPSLADMPKGNREHRLMVKACNGINTMPTKNRNNPLVFVRDMIFDADRVAIIKNTDGSSRSREEDYIWFALDYARCLEKDVRLIEISEDDERLGATK